LKTWKIPKANYNNQHKHQAQQKEKQPKDSFLSFDDILENAFNKAQQIKNVGE